MAKELPPGMLPLGLMLMARLECILKVNTSVPTQQFLLYSNIIVCFALQGHTHCHKYIFHKLCLASLHSVSHTSSHLSAAGSCRKPPGGSATRTGRPAVAGPRTRISWIRDLNSGLVTHGRMLRIPEFPNFVRSTRVMYVTPCDIP